MITCTSKKLTTEEIRRKLLHCEKLLVLHPRTNYAEQYVPLFSVKATMLYGKKRVQI